MATPNGRPQIAGCSGRLGPATLALGDVVVGDVVVVKGLRALAVAVVVAAAQPALAGPVVDRLIAASPRLQPQALRVALKAYERARTLGQTASSIVTLIDYSLPSTQRRLWVMDLGRGKLLFNELVAHGKRTGDDFAFAFSNQPGSLQSSLGAFVTGETYSGAHGLSLRLKGLEPGINDRAEEREIVIHAAPYVSDATARVLGRLGRSLGCPALPPDVAPRIIEAIKNGTFLFAYYPDPALQRLSTYLR